MNHSVFLRNQRPLVFIVTYYIHTDMNACTYMEFIMHANMSMKMKRKCAFWDLVQMNIECLNNFTIPINITPTDWNSVFVFFLFFFFKFNPFKSWEYREIRDSIIDRIKSHKQHNKMSHRSEQINKWLAIRTELRRKIVYVINWNQQSKSNVAVFKSVWSLCTPNTFR